MVNYFHFVLIYPIRLIFSPAYPNLAYTRMHEAMYFARFGDTIQFQKKKRDICSMWNWMFDFLNKKGYSPVSALNFVVILLLLLFLFFTFYLGNNDDIFYGAWYFHCEAVYFPIYLLTRRFCKKWRMGDIVQRYGFWYTCATRKINEFIGFMLLL